MDALYTSLNHGDAFLLDPGSKVLWLWMGSDCNYRKRNKALYFAKLYKEEQGGFTDISTIEDGKETKDMDHSGFWLSVGGKGN